MRHFTTFFCDRCGKTRRFNKRCVDYHRHLFATILTGGLWSVPWWVLRRRDAERPWRCCICNSLKSPAGESLQDPPPRTARSRTKRTGLATVSSRRQPLTW